MNGFGLIYFPQRSSVLIKQELKYIIDKLEGFMDEIEKELLKSIDQFAVNTFFNFPDNIKPFCIQYLFYFVQFISDLGIEIDAEIKEEINHTLFKVTPKDKNESLHKIKEALNIYLKAPQEENFQFELSSQTDVSVKQWELNINHLRNQLALANSIIQSKNVTINELQLSNYQYKQLLDIKKDNINIDSENVLFGLVTLNKYEGNGYSINLAELFRRLKRKLNK